MKTILITGAGGYIGSVATDLFLAEGYRVIAVDSFVRGFMGPITVLQEKYGQDKLIFIRCDLRDEQATAQIFADHPEIETVIHYAAFCNVGESEKQPEIYFDNNISATLSLVEAMRAHHVNKLVFSSTCSLYGEPQTDTIAEDHPVDPTSHPYGESKFMAERILDWYHKIYGLSFVTLRYFNVCGATDDGAIGDSKKPSFHLMQNAVRGALDIAPFYLNNTPVDTPDGTPIRDYVNVVDLNRAHLMAVPFLDGLSQPEVFNLGTGTGNSVLEVIEAVEQITGTTLPRQEGERRKGDVSKAVASNQKITSMLGWKPEHSLEDSVRSLVSWYETHPHGWES